MSVFNSLFGLGDIVYLITDPEQLERMVTYIKFSPGNQIVYYLSNITYHTEHYEMELSSKRNISLAMGLDKDNTTTM